MSPTVTKQWGFADGNREPGKLPDPKLDIRNYTVGDHVKFKIRYHGSDKEEILDGTVEIIDHYPGGRASIDVMRGDLPGPAIRRLAQTCLLMERHMNGRFTIRKTRR